MTQLNNLNSIPVDKTTDYFNNFFKPNFSLSQNVEEAIVGYFQQVTQDKSSATNLAAGVIFTAKAQNMDPMIVLQQFTKMGKGQLNEYLTMFLNLNRIGTSYLGIGNVPLTNKYISRTILP